MGQISLFGRTIDTPLDNHRLSYQALLVPLSVGLPPSSTITTYVVAHDGVINLMLVSEARHCSALGHRCTVRSPTDSQPTSSHSPII